MSMTPLFASLKDLSSWRSVATSIALIAGIWLLVAVVIASQGYAAGLANGNPQTWLNAFSVNVPWYSVWMLLTPFVIAIAHRVGFQWHKPVRSFAIHLVAAPLVAACHTAIYAPVAGFLYHNQPDLNATFGFFVYKLTGSIHVNSMIYLIIVAIIVVGRAYRDLRDREVAAAQLETRLAEAETAALRAQLQPHFLFNTLNAIAALVADDPVRAKRLIARLGDLLRLSLEDRRLQETTLEEELAFTDAYLAIESERLGERLTLERRIDPAALSTRVPALLLQPLVENAIRHGIAPLVRGGTLTLTADREGEHLRLVVSDDGRGADTLTEAVGLGNTRQRLHQLYGARQSFEVVTAPDAGFQVTIKVPA